MVGPQGFGLLLEAGLGVTALGPWLVLHGPSLSGVRHFADADDGRTVMFGKKVYMGHCASCHGRNLQGQPLWQLAGEYAGRGAPAQDETGHTWQHSDDEIFHVIK